MGAASDDGPAIIVTANRETSYILPRLSDYQFARYGERYGDHSNRDGAVWAYGLDSPVTTGGFGSPSPYSISLRGSFQSGLPLAAYDDAPAQQYMRGDGSTFRGTPSALARLEQQRTFEAHNAYTDRVRSSPLAGIALGYANMRGYSPEAQNLIYGAVGSLEGLGAAYAGVRGASLPGNNSQTSFGIEANIQLRYKPGWSVEQRASADLKVGVLNLSDATVSQVARGGFSAGSRYARENGPAAKGYDIDHLKDLQLGGTNTISNLWPLDYSVNRSLGSQVKNQIHGLPPGTRINRVTIGN